MAIITPTIENPSRGAYIFTWANMANGDTGAAVEAGMLPDKTLVVNGTFGAGGNLRLRGAVTSGVPGATDLQTLNDPQGNALDVLGAKAEALLELVRWYTPAVTAGDGTTSLTARIFAYGRPR